MRAGVPANAAMPWPLRPNVRRSEMATYVEGRSAASDVEPVGLVSEGVAGIAAIVLAVIALAGVSTGILASIVTIIIGVGLMVQAFNSAAEASRTAPAGVGGAEISGEVM